MPGGDLFPLPETVAADLARMAAAGINALRTYTVPPRWLLDAAHRQGLWVLVGLPWQENIAFLGDSKLTQLIERTVREGVRACAGHAALLGYAIANEIPAEVVRWHGQRRIERFIERLYRLAKTEDPEGLVAYINYPTTEYLELPFIDLFCFNVYLETPQKFAPYLARLQNLAGDKPLILSEMGLDSRRNGEEKQAHLLDWQIRLAFAGGSAGVFLFSWTDEWHHLGRDVDDWDFGLTRRDRRAKPALATVQRAFAEVPFPAGSPAPRISVVVCTYKGAATLSECLVGLQQVSYPDYEVIVVNDGADEAVAAVAKKFTVRLLDVPHSGLSAARNLGLAAATGEIIAYLDDDAWPDPHWLQYLAHTFATTDYAAVGGPNVPPPTNQNVANCVAHAPGGPIHVLLSDSEAEHIPGCNLAIRTSVLRALGGFDPQFHVAGDDVDICWRLTEAGLKIGFHPGAMVWHHRRKSVRAYLKQQSGYGRAEALLERKWPAKYNAAGQPAWHGRIYGAGRLSVLSWGRARIYHGTWGRALFQTVYAPAPSGFWSLARMPEWYLVILGLAVLFALQPLWSPLQYVWPVLLLAIGIPVAQAFLTARRTPVKTSGSAALLAGLHLLQPLARLRGRMLSGLTPWRPHRLRGFLPPYPRTLIAGSAQWRSRHEWLMALETPLAAEGASVFRGGHFDTWDLEVRGGVLGSVRLKLLVEDYGAGKQLVRVRVWPRWPLPMLVLCLANGLIAGGAARDGAWLATVLFGGLGLGLLFTTITEWGGAMAAVQRALRGVTGAGIFSDELGGQ